MESKGYSLYHVIVIIIATSIISAITVGVIFTKSFVSDEGVSYSELLVDENIQNFLNVYHELVSDYYENVDGKKVIQSAINGMMEYFDESYTTYLNEEETSNLNQQLNGKYEGIGVTIKNKMILTIVENSSAEKAGILEGDEIVSINDVSTIDLTDDEVVALIKNSADIVEIGINRGGRTYLYNVEITTLNVPSVSYEVLDDNIGYIKMDAFSYDVSSEVKRALDKLENKGIDSLIFDLRNNTGGYLDEAYDTASLFLSKNKIIYYLENKDDTSVYKDDDNLSTDYPIVVLVNQMSASASEILAAALKESYGAVIVGMTTYGKGKVQHTHSTSDGGLVKYTTSRWLTPDKYCIDGVGIAPDHSIENELIYAEDDINKENPIGVEDYQLKKAIEIIK